ncbi:MAG: hypothetical protein MR682_10845, partial [Subdoligranulum variabile]|nr:hypothetical protein [Subdoligranulum variabile]
MLHVPASTLRYYDK